MAGNTSAVAAFHRAAASWESWLTDPVSIEIHADLQDLGSSSIIGGTDAVFLVAPYDVIRDQMVADALLDEAIDDAIVASLPTSAEYSTYINSGFGLNGYIAATKANLKAMGFTGLDEAFGTNDANIIFNSGFSFDYDRSDGVAPGTMDFETVALHEIGHALGFISSVDDIDYYMSQGQTAAIYLSPLDLFRFPSTTNVTTANFASTPRSLVVGESTKFSDGVSNFSMSTGFSYGDGRQASHWKDDDVTGVRIGTMDPTLGYQEIRKLTYADLRALDVIGWDFDAAAFTAVPEPGTFVSLSLGIAGLAWLRRRRAV